MVKIEIVESLYKQIEKKFKQEAHKILDLFETLHDNPKKGKTLGTVGGIIIKELKYKNFRFYFITDGYKLKIYDKETLTDHLLRFVRMSNKKYQEKTIEEIRHVLLTIGPEGFI